MEEIVYRKAASKLQLTNMIIEGGHFTLGAQKPAADTDLQVRYPVLHFFFFFLNLFIYLAFLGLVCSLWNF